jgi:aspartate/glutamate racemase
MNGEQLPTAEYYRKVAQEIRRFAEQSQLPEVRRELLDLAERFDRMAQHIERRYPHRSG